jgi:hypothetical protein
VKLGSFFGLLVAIEYYYLVYTRKHFLEKFQSEYDAIFTFLRKCHASKPPSQRDVTFAKLANRGVWCDVTLCYNFDAYSIWLSHRI